MKGRKDQAALLVRLRTARMASASRALAEAAAETRRADAARASADAAATQAEAALEQSRADRAADLAEVDRHLALVDHALFGRVMAEQSAAQARDALAACEAEETARRRAMILARARHDVLADMARDLRTAAIRAEEERAALEIDDDRRPT